MKESEIFAGMSYVVYRLVDPRTQSTFYVGVTDNLAARYIQHLRCSGNNVRKNTRIQEIKEANLLPIPETLEIVEERPLGLKRERYWIQHYRYLGEDLLNASFPAGEHEPAMAVEEVKGSTTVRLIGLTYEEAAKLPLVKKAGKRLRDLKRAARLGLIQVKRDGSVTKTAVEKWARSFM